MSNRITAYGQIPYTVPIQLIVDMIKAAAKYFYEWFPSALYHTSYLINKNEIEKYRGFNGFNTNQIIISPKIKNINRVYEINDNYIKDTDWTSFSMQSMITGGFIEMNHPIGINNHLLMIENAVKMVEINAIKNMFKTNVPFSFNHRSNVLEFRVIPKNHLLLDVDAALDVDKLYNDPYFERYVIATTKRELKRIIGSHTINLPGGATLNVDEICNNLEEIQEIEQQIKAMNGMGDIINRR